jgi:hypothetical protein
MSEEPKVEEESGDLCFNVGPSVTRGPALYSVLSSYGHFDWDNILECEVILEDPKVQGALLAYLQAFNEKAMELGFAVAAEKGVPQEKLAKIKAKRQKGG